MADIFISYARDDRDRVRVVAETLMAEGFSVWWDPEIMPGTTFDEVIERELDAAKCALVIWSEASRTSRWVKTEAGEAADRDVLIPVILEHVKIPLAFRHIQAEPLIDWQGDREAESWQRIILQADALVGGRQGVSDTSSAAELPKAEKPANETANSGASSTFILTAIAGAILTGMWAFGTRESFGILSATLALAAMAFILFRFAETDMSPHMKALARRWLLPVKGEVKVNAVEAFLNLFEAVFSKKHLSWRCVWRSALASMIGFLIMLAIFDFMRPHASAYAALLTEAQFGLGVFMVVGMLNIFGDYFSLGETRLLLRAGAQRPHLLPFLILSDALLTFVIFSAGIVLFITIVPAYYAPPSASRIAQLAYVLEGTTQGLLDISRLDFNFSNKKQLIVASVLGASLATAYITSIWLWLAVIFGPLARVFVWSRTKGATMIGKLFDVERHPFTALGYLTALFVLISGSIIWGVAQAMAAMG